VCVCRVCRVCRICVVCVRCVGIPQFPTPSPSPLSRCFPPLHLHLRHRLYFRAPPFPPPSWSTGLSSPHIAPPSLRPCPPSCLLAMAVSQAMLDIDQMTTAVLPALVAHTEQLQGVFRTIDRMEVRSPLGWVAVAALCAFFLPADVRSPLAC
jgi:hypothetical protein